MGPAQLPAGQRDHRRPRTEAQWDSDVEALKLDLGPEDEKLVDSLVPPGHASTPGYSDPGHPIEGRVAA